MSDVLEKMADGVLNGKIKEMKGLAEQAVDEGLTPQDIIFDGLSKGMEIVGDKYEKKEYFLPQVLLSAQAMYAALDVVLPILKEQGSASAEGSCVIGVVEGDVHDIGKNIVKAMITGIGMDVYDMGRDIPSKDYIDKCEEVGANVLATSTLMTPTLAGMKELEKMLAERNLKGKTKSMIGGGATSKEFAEQIGADAWGYDAIEGVKIAKRLVQEGRAE
ncbi:MAG: B12-binding domain-containing protein [Methanomassiliicoccales archaeon]